MDIIKARQAAQQEIDDENFKKEVFRYKQIIRSKKSLWDIFPYRIIIIKKEKQNG